MHLRAGAEAANARKWPNEDRDFRRKEENKAAIAAKYVKKTNPNNRKEIQMMLGNIVTKCDLYSG